MFEALVIGGGPAGLAAALTLGRAHRQTLVLDSGQGRNAPADAIHNFVTRDGTPPAEFRAIGRDQLRTYPTVSVRDATAVSAVSLADGFEVTLADGSTERAKRLLLATGLVDTMPAVDGVAEIWGRSAFHCPYCHGYEISGKPIAVLGGSPDRVRLALHLSRFSSDIVLCTNGAEVDETRVKVQSAPITRLVSTDGQLEAVQFADGSTLPRDAIFVKTSWRQRSPLPEQLGCAAFEYASIEVNEQGQTSVPGVYAAGDMCRRATVHAPQSAVIAAAASGTMAAIMLDQNLVTADFDLPDPFVPQKTG
jgi:thioredoxin reductase